MKPILDLKWQVVVFATTAALVACGGGSEATSETPAPTPTPTPVPAPSPSPTPTVCVAEPIGSTGYSLVFKGCSVAGVAEYYDKSQCVRDNATGRIWEGKSTNGSALNYVDRYFLTNFDSTTLLQYRNSTTTVISSPTTAQVNAADNTLSYKNAVNSAGICGFTDWRLPSKDELAGLVDRSRASGEPTINATWFPVSSNRSYWTSTVGPNDYQAWYVFFGNGNASAGTRTLQPLFVRLIR